jgi:hypothetical protein
MDLDKKTIDMIKTGIPMGEKKKAGIKASPSGPLHPFWIQ